MKPENLNVAGFCHQNFYDLKYLFVILVMKEVGILLLPVISTFFIK